MSRKPKYFDNIKSHSTLERAVMEFIIPRRWDRNELIWQWTKNLEYCNE